MGQDPGVMQGTANPPRQRSAFLSRCLSVDLEVDPGCVVALLGFYLSMIFTSAALNPEEKKS